MALEKSVSLKFLLTDQLEALLAAVKVSTFNEGEIVI
jgi:hypothetical protein